MSQDTVALIDELGQVLTSTDFPEVARQVVCIAHRNSQLERVRFYLANPSSNMLIQQGIAGAAGDEQAELSMNCLPARVALQATCPVITDLPGPETGGSPARMIPSCLVPFRLPSAHVGLLVGDNPSGRLICEHDEKLLKALAQFAAAGIGHSVTGKTGIDQVSLVSHELRTPLTAVYAFTEMLLDGDAGPLNPAQEEYLSQAFESASLLKRIVEDLLELTRLEQGKARLEPTLVDVRGFVLDTVNNFQPQAQAREIAIAASVSGDLPKLTTDKNRLRQALGNLIDNALKYSPSGSAVTVTAEADNGQVWIAVRDQGPGITPEDQGRVFDAFFRCFKGEDSLRQKGSGLGLAVVQCIARLLGAECSLDSTVGEGSTFTLTFPVHEAPVDNPRVPCAAELTQKSQ